jgi:predicted phosphodiesterase
MGNADAWMLTGEETGAEATSERQLAIRQWSLAQLSEADQAFIAGFQPTVELELGGDRRLLCFHGSPHSFDDLIFPETPEEEFQRLLGPFAAFVLTGGHTHLQQIRRLDDTFFFNPGSVGFAYNRRLPESRFHADPWAEYAVLSAEGRRLSLEFRRVPLDPAELIRVTLVSGMPYAESVASRYQS